MNKAYIPLLVGLGVGVVAIKMGLDVVKRAKGDGISGTAVTVVVAAKTIPLATEITEQMLTTVATSDKLVPSSAFVEKDKLVGRVSRTEIPQGIPVLGVMLAPPGTMAGMSSRIPAGFRAVSVKVDEASQVGGFLQPGCHVDVAVVMSAKIEGRSETISRVILQDVEVAAVGQSLEGEATGGATLTRSVTLLLSPDDVPKLHLAATKGKIHLAMRNQSDDKTQFGGSTNENELIEGKQPGVASGSDGSPLGMLLHGFAQSLQPKPEPVVEVAVVEPTKPVEETPWSVEVVEGNKFTSVEFRSVDSMDRVGPGSVNNAVSSRGVGLRADSLRVGASDSTGRTRDVSSSRVVWPTVPVSSSATSNQQDTDTGSDADHTEE